VRYEADPAVFGYATARAPCSSATSQS
jgi:hypothetical protein